MTLSRSFDTCWIVQESCKVSMSASRKCGGQMDMINGLTLVKIILNTFTNLIIL